MYITLFFKARIKPIKKSTLPMHPEDARWIPSGPEATPGALMGPQNDTDRKSVV